MLFCNYLWYDLGIPKGQSPVMHGHDLVCNVPYKKHIKKAPFFLRKKKGPDDINFKLRKQY